MSRHSSFALTANAGWPVTDIRCCSSVRSLTSLQGSSLRVLPTNIRDLDAKVCAGVNRSCAHVRDVQNVARVFFDRHQARVAENTVSYTQYIHFAQAKKV